MKTEILEIEKEEVEQNLKTLNKARELITDGKEICESDIPADLITDWKKLNLKFIDEQISNSEQLQEQYENDLNAEISLFSLPIRKDTETEFDEMPINDAELSNLNNLIDDSFIDEDTEYYKSKERGDY